MKLTFCCNSWQNLPNFGRLVLSYIKTDLVTIHGRQKQIYTNIIFLPTAPKHEKIHSGLLSLTQFEPDMRPGGGTLALLGDLRQLVRMPLLLLECAHQVEDGDLPAQQLGSALCENVALLWYSK